MEPIYRYSESTVKPLGIEATKTTIYLRTDITEIERVYEDGNKVTFWTYKEAAMTPDEFNEYSSFIAAKNAINGVDDSSNISQLVSGQANGDNNQLIIMEAIADLYDAISTML